ncbi:MAG: short-chain dehydrogenase/reductase SDR [Hyphomonadaceae bacterium]|nr:MAG: short-chain dehydrogenase/reductase SDR [Hyphomonadaceae bacterium]
MTENSWAKGRIAFISGATSGFGHALARRILAAGGKVIATGRRADRLAAFAAEAATPNLLTLQLDVTKPTEITAAIANLPPAFQAIDILFNNAGLALGIKGAHEASLQDWDTMIATNISGLVHLTHAILPGMVSRNRGDIINVGSVAGSYPYPGGNVYGATKAFVHQFSLNLRADLLGKNIRVTSFEPGMCETEFSEVRFAGDKAAAAKVYASAKPLSADDVALTIEGFLRLPSHINVNTIEIMPVCQAFSPFAVHREN